MTSGIVRALSLSSRKRPNDSPNSDGVYPTSSQRLNGHALIDVNGVKDTDDFWVPEVSAEGQIYYVNTHTGEHSRDLPREAEDSSDEESVSLANSASLTSPGAVSTSRSAVSEYSPLNVGSSNAGFGAPSSSRTPEPWLRRLTDDGKSYYYQNRENGEVSWTLPDSDPPPPPYTDDRVDISPLRPARPLSRHSTRARDSSLMPLGPRMPSTPPKMLIINRSNSASERVGTSSEKLEVRPLQRKRSASSANVVKPSPGFQASINRLSTVPELPGSALLGPIDEAEKTLQKALSSPLNTTIELFDRVRQAIAALLEYLQSVGPSRRPQRTLIDDRILEVVDTVRELLYISVPPVEIIPPDLIPGKPHHTDLPSSHPRVKSHFKKSYYDVAGNLSNLVFGCQALQRNPNLSVEESRLEVAAEELQHTVAAFVAEAQRFEYQHSTNINGARRRHGAFSTVNMGLGRPGAGNAGSWKGLGYPLSEREVENYPTLLLRSDVIAKLKTLVAKVERELRALVTYSTSSYTKAERLQSEGQSIVAHLSSLLSFVNDINVAQHVHILCNRTSPSPSLAEGKAHITERTSALVRNMEFAIQAIYDDAALMFLTSQASRTEDQPKPVTPHIAQFTRCEYMASLVTEIMANVSLVVSTLETLVEMGRDPSENLRSPNSSPTRRRTSAISIVDVHIYPNPRNQNHSPQEKARQKMLVSRPSVKIKTSFENPQGLPTASRSETSLFSPESRRTAGTSRSILDNVSTDSASYISSFVGSQIRETEPLTPDELSSPLFSSEGPPMVKPPKGAKIIKLLGSDAPQRYIDLLNLDSIPWYLRPTYDPSEILIDEEGAVRAGTPAALVEWLTAHDHADPRFVKYFLLTFKSFMTLDELFDMLVCRFRIQPPDQLTAAEWEDWRKQKQLTIQMRVLNTFKSMLTDDAILEQDDIYILGRMKQFISSPEVITFAPADPILTAIDRVQGGGKARIKTLHGGISPPSPILPRTLKDFKLLDIDPLELARQLTLMESRLYRRIRPMECLQRSKGKQPEGSDNISLSIQLSNRIMYWVTESVLSRPDAKKRGAIIKHFILVADRCREMHNMSTMVAIISGLNAPSAHRLKKSWEQVNARYLAIFSSCEAIYDPDKNFSRYWSTLSSISPPCIPFVGRYLSTLTFINDGAEDNLSEQMVNFRKRQRAAEVIQDIKRRQTRPYNFQTVACVLAFLEECFNKYGEGVDYSDQFWRLSQEREPREKDGERMVRMLHESGFL